MMTEIEKTILHNQQVMMEALLALIDYMGMPIPNLGQKNECQRNLLFAMDDTIKQLKESEE